MGIVLDFKGIFSSILFCFVIYFNGFAKEYHVGEAQAYQSIHTAIEACDHGDEIIVHHGIYKEGNYIILKAVTLTGIDYPIIDGEFESEIFTIEHDSVTIQGFQIQNVGISMVKDRAGIKVESQKHCIIQNNKLIDTFFGIYLAKSKHCKVLNNTLIGEAKEEATSGNAIHLWYCKDILVEGNDCSHHRDGVYIEFSSESKFLNNKSHENIRYGLHFMFSDHNVYQDNLFQNNSAGVAVMYSDHILMERNEFLDNWGSASYGLLLKEIKDSDLRYNLFKRNTIGIFAEGSNRINVLFNTLESNGWAIKIMGSCESNVFTSNNFISNTFDMSTNGKNSLGNTFNENFWSEYTGYDLDKDGFGDIPYKPVSLFSYVVENNPSATILLRSLFIDVLNVAEKVTPVLTPETFDDNKPLMRKVLW